MKCCLFDPAVENELNTGDLIISHAVRYELTNKTKISHIERIPTLRCLTDEEWDKLNESDVVLVGGTNLLNSTMWTNRQWKFDLRLMLKTKVILMGVGWWQYQPPPKLTTNLLLQRILSKDFKHSLRDQYSANHLSTIKGVSFLNTSCPTLWSLPQKRVVKNELTSSRNILTTLTYYSPSPLDKIILERLLDEYDEVALWPQGAGDETYLESLFNGNVPSQIHLLDRSLYAFDQAIMSGRYSSYLGSRLHGGIRAASQGLEYLIFAVDNRALEISRDTGLNVIARDKIGIHSKTYSDLVRRLDIRLPQSEIAEWCAQF